MVEEIKILDKILDDKQLVKEKMFIEIESYVNNKKKKIYLRKKINNNSFNIIFLYSKNKRDKVIKNRIIRISNKNTNSKTIKSELDGIKIQFRLSQKSKFIGKVIDIGKVIKLCPNNFIEYSIQEKVNHLNIF